MKLFGLGVLTGIGLVFAAAWGIVWTYWEMASRA